MFNFFNGLYSEVEKAVVNGSFPLIGNEYLNEELDLMAEELPSILAYGENSKCKEVLMQNEELLTELFRYIIDEYNTYKNTSFEPDYFESIDTAMKHSKTRVLSLIDEDKAKSIIEIYKNVKRELM